MLKNRLFSLIFIIIFLIGCTPQPTPKPEPVHFSVLYNDRKAAPFKADWRIMEEYKTRQNVILDVQLGDDADYMKAIVHALESESPPDIILKVYPKEIENYASAGVLLPFSDYEKEMPHFMAYIKEYNYQAELDKLRISDGKYYILPGFQRQIQTQQWIYRRDVFEENNLAIPTNYDELFESLVALKKIYPNSTPLTTLWGGAHLFAMMGAGYGIPAGWSGSQYYNKTEDRWQFAPATENYKALYTFLNRCYEAGILDTAMFTQSDDDFYNKIQDGRAFVTVAWVTSGFDTWNAKLIENGIPNGEWVALPVLESTIGIKALPAVNSFRKGLVVPSRVVNKPYFKDLLKFLDWAVYSEEGRTLTSWGIEDFTFTNTPNGKVYLPSIKTPKNPAGTIEISKEYGFDTIFNLSENVEFEDYKKPAEIVAFLKRSLEAQETLDVSPQLKLDAQTIEATRIINEKLTPYVAEMSTKFITGEMNMNEDWDAYVIELKNRGYDTLEEIWNDAWKNQNK